MQAAQNQWSIHCSRKKSKDLHGSLLALGQQERGREQQRGSHSSKGPTLITHRLENITFQTPLCSVGSLPKPNGVTRAKGAFPDHSDSFPPRPTPAALSSDKCQLSSGDLNVCRELAPSCPPISLRNWQQIKKF